MAELEQLDVRSAAGKPPEQALFFYQGDSEVVAPGVFFPKIDTSTVFGCDDRLLVVDTSPRWVAHRTIAELREKHSKAPVEAIIYTHGHIDYTSTGGTWRHTSLVHSFLPCMTTATPAPLAY